MGRLIVVGCVALALVGCSSSVKVEDATVTLPRVALVTATPNLVRDAAAATRATVQTGSTDAANTGGNGAAPVTGDGTVVTVIATEGAMLRAQPTTEAEALLQVPPGRNLALVGADISDGTSRWLHVRYGERVGYIRSDLVDQPHRG